MAGSDPDHVALDQLATMLERLADAVAEGHRRHPVGERTDGALAALANAARALDEERAARAAAAGDHEYRRGMIALRLAPGLDTCRALLRGEPVHPGKLDREALARLRADGLDI